MGTPNERDSQFIETGIWGLLGPILAYSQILGLEGSSVQEAPIQKSLSLVLLSRPSPAHSEHTWHSILLLNTIIYLEVLCSCNQAISVDINLFVSPSSGAGQVTFGEAPG